MVPLKKIRTSGVAITISVLLIFVLGSLDYLFIIDLSVKWYVALVGGLLFFTIDFLFLRNFEANKIKIEELQRSVNRIEENLFSDENKTTSRDRNIVNQKKINSKRFNNSVIDTYGL